MRKDLTFDLDGSTIRFTPDGKISIIDGIKALSNSEEPEVLWDRLKGSNPDIVEYCEEFTFHKGRNVPVTDSEGWDKIQLLLFEEMIA